ncbi:MAG TPA: sulfite exporter TauE/SafE family protein [Solirubrobacteraceae bacterium]|jgi:uncharacterized membrane protein YfcA|nr:sulfite exporter TauE/SafE family protein [Solirubrobacteraceae bacterium]
MPLIAAAAVAAGAALQSATGFGFSVVAAPLVFAAVGPQEAVGLLLVLGTEVNLLTLATERRRPQPELRECAVLVGCALPGAFAGVAALRALDPVALQVAVSVGVIATLAARHLSTRRHTPAWAGPIAGLAAGGLSTSTTTAGPPMLVYLLGRGLSPVQLRDSLPVCFLGLTVISVIALAATGTSGAVPDPLLAAVLVPVVAAGHLSGRPLFAALARSRRYEPVVTALLLVSVVAGLATAVF